MRIAAFSDVHGDVAALEMVLNRISAECPDMIANLGDAFAGDLFPRETADLLATCSITMVRGNHERIMTTAPLATMPRPDRNAVDALGPNHLRWVRQLPSTVRLGGDVLMLHGTPTDDTIGMLETATPQGLRVASDEEIETRLAGDTSKLVLCGHTHVPRVHRRMNGQLIVCPGSVSRPLLENNTDLGASRGAISCYAVATEEAGVWNAEIVLLGPAGSSRRQAFAAMPDSRKSSDS